MTIVAFARRATDRGDATGGEGGIAVGCGGVGVVLWRCDSVDFVRWVRCEETRVWCENGERLEKQLHRVAVQRSHTGRVMGCDCSY